MRASRARRSFTFQPLFFAELYFLNEKKERPVDFSATFALLVQSAQFILLPIEPIDTLEFERDRVVSDIHDRIIVGVARRVNATLLTRDAQIASSGVVATVGSVGSPARCAALFVN
jgi:PIN domain nuclease of toxin-antitoxin system